MKNIKIYKFSDEGTNAEYVAASSFEEAIKFYCEWSDQGIDEIGDVLELDEAAMERYEFFEDEFGEGESISFKAALQKKIADGEDFPLHFASVEW